MPQYPVYIPLIHAGKANNNHTYKARQKQWSTLFHYGIASGCCMVALFPHTVLCINNTAIYINNTSLCVGYTVIYINNMATYTRYTAIYVNITAICINNTALCFLYMLNSVNNIGICTAHFANRIYYTATSPAIAPFTRI